MAAAGMTKPEWKKYLKRSTGRHDFQIDLGLALINRGIEWDWPEGKPRPEWMRRRGLVPCECGKCYFCLHEMTNGIAHKGGNCDRVVVYSWIGVRRLEDRESIS